MEIFFATGNVHKVAKIAAVLEYPVVQIDIDLPELQAVDAREVIEAKAKAAYDYLNKPVLVEDTSLAFLAWNGLPGALIKHFLHTVDNAGICKMLASFEDKRAIAETHLGYFDRRGIHIFSGQVPGKIVDVPRGKNGFGWDPIFQPDGHSKTFAEMSLQELDQIDLRKEATLQLKQYLEDNHIH